MNTQKEYIHDLLEKHVSDSYQRLHAKMVATAMQGYATKFGENEDEWYAVGLLHDLDYDLHPDTHPAESLVWFKDLGYSEDFCHAVEAHAYGYNGFDVLPKTRMANALMACDEISGIFYAYRQMNPVPYGEMKVKSIMKKIKDRSFAAKIDREDIIRGCEGLEIEIRDHVENLISFFSGLN